MKNNFKNGFTLIELLVVVAIIAILTSVVLVALNDSKNKGADAAIKANLNTIKGQSELFYSDNGNSFLPAGGTPITGISTCPTVAGTTNMFNSDTTIFNSITEARNRGRNQTACHNVAGFWAVSIGLKSDSNGYWCVDSGGASRKVMGGVMGVINTIDTTTHACN